MKAAEKHLRIMRVLSLVLALAGCAGSPKTGPAVSGLMSLDEAIETAALAVEERVAAGSEIAIYKITARHDEIGDYLCEELNDQFTVRGKLIPLAREAALRYVDAEHQFQESGFVTDASAVGIGNYLGAKIVITGTFDRYADFSQLRLRAVDVQTSALVASYNGRVQNNDQVLVNITAPLGTDTLVKISNQALDHLNRGKDLFMEKKLDEALQEFDQVIAINSKMVEAYYYRGFSYYYNMNYDNAILDASQAIELDPDYIFAYFLRGLSYYSKDENDNAITDFNQAIRLDPNNLWTYFGIALVNSEIGNYEQVIINANAVIRLNPNFADIYGLRGLAYARIGNYDNAIKDYTEMFRLDPTDNPNFYGDYTIRGQVYVEIGDLDKAITDFTRAMKINPNFATAYYNRGNVYKDIGNFDQAIEDYTKAIQINPDELDFYDSRAFVYLKKGDMDRAIADLVQGIRLVDADYFNIRGVSLYNLGYIDNAIAHWKAILQVNPNHTVARENLEIAEQQQGR